MKLIGLAQILGEKKESRIARGKKEDHDAILRNFLIVSNRLDLSLGAWATAVLDLTTGDDDP